jgi:hypothetical protein
LALERVDLAGPDFDAADLVALDLAPLAAAALVVREAVPARLAAGLDAAEVFELPDVDRLAGGMRGS